MARSDHDIVLVKRPDHLWAAADTWSIDKLGTFCSGEAIRGHFRRERELGRHRQFFKLLELGFDHWEPEPNVQALPARIRQEPIQKNRERFRKDVLILAGFYNLVVRLDGQVRAEALSMSFAAMDEPQFRRLYKQVCDVIWRKILAPAHYKSPEEVDQVVRQMLSFDRGA